MLSPWIYLMMNGLFFTLRLSGGSGSFPRPLKAAEEREYLERFVGRTLPVLFEEERDGLWRGHTTRYSEVAAPSGENLHNQLRQVYITGRAGNTLQGELCEGQEK